MVRVVKNPLQAFQVGLKTDRVLSSQRVVFTLGLVSDFGDTGLTKPCFPGVPADSPNARGINGVNDDTLALAFCACRVRIYDYYAISKKQYTDHSV